VNSNARRLRCIGGKERCRLPMSARPLTRRDLGVDTRSRNRMDELERLLGLQNIRLDQDIPDPQSIVDRELREHRSVTNISVRAQDPHHRGQRDRVGTEPSEAHQDRPGDLASPECTQARALHGGWRETVRVGHAQKLQQEERVPAEPTARA
jgi:hypothetical protein